MKNLTPSEQLKAIIQFRKKSLAPVDTMGASKVGDTKDEKIYRFQTLIGLMLSSQTKDEKTSQAVKNLKEGLDGGLTPSTLSSANQETVEQLIKQVSFYKTKAGRIIEAAQICQKDYDNDIPRTIKGLESIKGVGVKMATLCMAHAWHDQVGIGVDVHVHRIAQRLKWVKTNHPDQTETELQKLFPKELWAPLNDAIVGFGQTICSAVKPKCDLCPISDSCPYYNNEGESESEEEKSPKKSSKNSSQKAKKQTKNKKKNKKSSQKKKGGRRKDDFEESDSDIEDFVVDDDSSEKEASESDFSDYD